MLYYCQDSLYTGDTLFVGGCGRFNEGPPSAMNHALNRTIATLPLSTKVHGLLSSLLLAVFSSSLFLAVLRFIAAMSIPRTILRFALAAPENFQLSYRLSSTHFHVLRSLDCLSSQATHESRRSLLGLKAEILNICRRC